MSEGKGVGGSERVSGGESAGGSGRVRVGLAVVAACGSAVGLYGVLRVAQAIVFPESDPAMVIWSEHAGFFWRVWTVGYIGGMVGILTWMAAGRDAARVARVLVRALPVAAGLLAAQAIFVP
ncbi:MAG: hypothetical protein JWP87_3094 [Labilithrix sp.]|nr:hypothetical protein [Labilithrix sp.]